MAALDSRTRLLLPAVALATVGCSATLGAPEVDKHVSVDDYAAAERLLKQHLVGEVRNESPAIQWLGSDDRFWYQRDSRTGPENVLIDAATGTRQSGYQPEVNESRPTVVPGSLPSPDGTWTAFSREHNLWIRQNRSGEERPLTDDGEAFFTYGGFPDQYRLDAMRAGMNSVPSLSNSYWSPNSLHLIVGRLDERSVSDYHFLESVPSNGSARVRSYSVKVPLLGDEGQRATDTLVFDPQSGDHWMIDLPPGISLTYFATQNSPVGWSADGNTAFFLGADKGDKTVQFLAVDLVSRETRAVFTESVASSVSLGPDLFAGPAIRLLERTQEVVWYSERDGWGHLYLYDLESGQLKNRITGGEWAVWNIVHIDTERRLVYFMAAGREPGSDRYYGKLYKVALDGSNLQLLTPEEAHHEVQGPFSPSGEFFVETYSTVNTAPRTVLRSASDGSVVAALESADTKGLYAAGWHAPKRLKLKAADGVTDIWAAVYFPPDYDHRSTYPIIDAIYGGPANAIAPRSLTEAYESGYQPASLTALGFIVVVMDGRGTPFRSRAFREVGYGNFADPQLADHVAVIQQLAAQIPSIDLDRVGIYGHSNGGYMTARAMLKHPEFFKVGVASAGPHNFHGLPGTGMPWMGIPDDATGTEIPENYRILDNAQFADGLQGNLLLISGDMDKTAFPALTLQLADALTKANKSFDMLYLPNRNHRYFVDEPYVIRRIWDYFVEHLHGTTPPLNYEMAPW